MTKDYVFHSPHFSKHKSYDGDLWYTCVKMITYPVTFFTFSEFWFYRLLGGGGGRGGGGVKGQKLAQSDKRLCLSNSMSQELCLIGLWFLVHLCKMMIFCAVFSFFQKILIFWIFKEGGGGGQKMTHNYQFLSVS